MVEPVNVFMILRMHKPKHLRITIHHCPAGPGMRRWSNVYASNQCKVILPEDVAATLLNTEAWHVEHVAKLETVGQDTS